MVVDSIPTLATISNLLKTDVFKGFFIVLGALASSP